MYILCTIVEGRVTEEEVIATSCRCRLAAVGFQELIDGVAYLLHLFVEGVDSLLEQLVSRHVLADVEVSLQVSMSLGLRGIYKRLVGQQFNARHTGNSVLCENRHGKLTCVPVLT